MVGRTNFYVRGSGYTPGVLNNNSNHNTLSRYIIDKIQLKRYWVQTGLVYNWQTRVPLRTLKHTHSLTQFTNDGRVRATNLRASPADQPNFYTVWLMNSDIQFLLTHFSNILSNRLSIPFSISFKYYFFIYYLFFF